MPTRSRRPARQPSAAASPTAIPATATASWTSRRPAPGRLDGWAPVLTISSGHSAEYLTAAVAAGRENYYTGRSEEHTSELQSRRDLVCRLLLEKKKKK